MSCMYRTCRPGTILDNPGCAIQVTSTSSAYCTRVCSRVTYTVTITNTCNIPVRDVNVHVPLMGVFCLDPTTVTVNGEAVEVACLDSIPVGELDVNETATVVYTVTVMEYRRYIKVRALVTYYTCCCLQRKDVGVYSNCNLLQVCNCCACCETTTTTNP